MVIVMMIKRDENYGSDDDGDKEKDDCGDDNDGDKNSDGDNDNDEAYSDDDASDEYDDNCAADNDDNKDGYEVAAHYIGICNNDTYIFNNVDKWLFIFLIL